MKWCLNRHIRIYAERYAEKIGRYYKEKDLYRITVEQGDRVKSTDWMYNKKQLPEALMNMWIKTYEVNNGKKVR